MQVYYLLKCKCKWWRKCLGTSADFKDLVEFKPCINCHGPRKYKCPKCGSIMKAMRVEGPDPPELKEDPNPVTPVPEPVVEVPAWTPPPGFIPKGGLAPIDPPPLPKPEPPTETPPTPEPDKNELAKELGRLLARRLRGEK